MVTLLLVLVLLASGGPCAISFKPFARRPSFGAIQPIRLADRGLLHPHGSASTLPRPFHRPLENPLSARSRSDVAMGISEGGEGGRGDDALGNVQRARLLSKLSRGIVPLSASIGFLAAPSTKVAAKVTGAAIGGVVGLVARHYLRSQEGPKAAERDAESDESSIDLPPRVAAALRIVAKQPSVLSLDLNRLETIASKNRVDEKSLELYFTHVLMEAVLEATRGDSFDLTDLGGLFDFIQSVGFSNAEIGHGLALAAISLRSQLPRDERGFFAADYPQEVFYQACKIFFLADKLLDTWEDYFGGGVQVALSCFTPQQYKEQITKESRRLFQKCIDGVLSDPDAFTLEEVTQLRAFLTTSPTVSDLRPEDMEGMLLAAMHASLDQLVHAPSQRDSRPAHGTALLQTTQISSLDKLRKAQEVLGWSPRELLETVETRTLPLFEQIAQQLFQATSAQPSQAANLSLVLQEHLSTLHISPATARKVLLRTLSDLNTNYMQQLEHVYSTSSGSLPAVYKILVAYVHAHEGWMQLVRPVLQEGVVPLPGLPFTEDIRRSLLEFDLAHSSSLSQSPRTQDLLALSPEVRSLVRRNLAIPKVTQWIHQCIQEKTFSASARQAYQQTLQELDVSPQTWMVTAADLYYQELSKIAQQKAVPALEDVRHFQELRGFLELQNRTLIQQIHVDVFGEKYTKALSETWAASNGWEEGYREGLERLRQRLELDDTTTRQLHATVAREQLVSSLKGLKELQKADRNPPPPQSSPSSQLGFISSPTSQNAPSSASTSSTGRTFMQQAVHLVESLDSLCDGEEGSVTAVGETVSTEDLASLHKHFLLLSISEPDAALRQRYEQVEGRFARWLGLDDTGQRQVKESLAFGTFKSLLRRYLSQQELIPPQLLGQFATLKGKLHLTSEASEKVFALACKAAIQSHVREMMERHPKPSTVTMNPEDARRLREQVHSLGLSMSQDTALSTSVLALLFALEVRYLVDHDAMAELADVREAYDIPETRAADLVEAVCARYLDQVLNLALKTAKRYEEEDCIRYTSEVVRYLPWVHRPVLADKQLFSESDKDRMVSFYLAEMEVQEGEQGEQEKKRGLSKQEVSRLLRDGILLSKDYVGPRQGMEGLLGLLPDLDERARNLDKNTWAWG